jgi:hypothetical protein
VSRLRYASMYVLSASIGWLIAVPLILLGQRWKYPVHELIHGNARSHAEAAARKEGPYLAPVTALLIMAIVGLIVWWAA